jgi:hypothetical protein
MHLAQSHKAEANAQGNNISFSEAIDSVTANIGLDKDKYLKQAQAIDEKLTAVNAKKTAVRVQAYKAKMEALGIYLSSAEIVDAVMANEDVGIVRAAS